MARCEPCRSTTLCSLSSSFLPPSLPAASQIAAAPKNPRGATTPLHFKPAHGCLDPARDLVEQTEMWITGAQQLARVAAAGPGCLCCRRKELQRPRQRNAEFCSPPLLGHGRKSAASFHCAACTSSMPRGSPPTSLGEEGERLAGTGSVGLKDSGQEAPDLQGPGGEDIGAAKQRSLLPPAVCDEQLRKCLEWHFPAWHPTQTGSSAGCKSNTEEIT